MTARRNIPQKATPLHFKTVTLLTFAALKEKFQWLFFLFHSKDQPFF